MMHGKTLAAVLATALAATLSIEAHAGGPMDLGPDREEPAPRRESPASRREAGATDPAGASWYGWQTFLADAVSAGLFAGGIAARNGAIAVVGGIGYVAGAPTIHGLHGSSTRTGLSVALRLGLPLLGYLIADGMSTCKDPAEEPCDLPGAMGATGGALLAAPIDWFAVSWEPAQVRVVPSVSWQKHGGTIGLMGTF